MGTDATRLTDTFSGAAAATELVSLNLISTMVVGVPLDPGAVMRVLL